MFNRLFLVISLPLIFIACSSSKTTQSDDKSFIYYTSGTQHLVAKKYTEALTDLLEAEKLDPKSSEVQNNLAMTYYFKNEFDLARAHWKKALDLDEKNLDARNNLASLYFTQKNFNEAKKQYEIVLSDLTYPNQFRTYYNIGLIENIQKNYDRARDMFQKAIDENENYCPAYFQLGLMSYESGDYKAAYDRFKNAGIGDCVANSSDATYYQGLCSMKMGNSERARLKFLDLIKRFPNSPFALKAQAQIERIEQIESNSVVKSAIQDGLPSEEQKQSFVTP
ncbi:MAG: tetratricopeptide repeat protein [Bacteriovoracaceae bacterium]